ncbi:hypothetical protein C8F04DRAFT_1235735 [Mycena alexandri]|uniref:Uncharacterized protein n=1 Tax=Mycena alexandri TaxID=1745969 RepID=A0AAD6WY94_9AGAR|nr:hypothetical protein C8F04DRAFT_1235735 [Mycena alexandri]
MYRGRWSPQGRRGEGTGKGRAKTRTMSDTQEDDNEKGHSGEERHLAGEDNLRVPCRATGGPGRYRRGLPRPSQRADTRPDGDAHEYGARSARPRSSLRPAPPTPPTLFFHPITAPRRAPTTAKTLSTDEENDPTRTSTSPAAALASLSSVALRLQRVEITSGGDAHESESESEHAAHSAPNSHSLGGEPSFRRRVQAERLRMQRECESVPAARREGHVGACERRQEDAHIGCVCGPNLAAQGAICEKRRIRGHSRRDRGVNGLRVRRSEGCCSTCPVRKKLTSPGSSGSFTTGTPLMFSTSQRFLGDFSFKMVVKTRKMRVPAWRMTRSAGNHRPSTSWRICPVAESVMMREREREARQVTVT